MDTNDRLIRAVHVATRKLAGSGNFNELMKDALAICVRAVGGYGGTIYLHDPASKRLRFQHVLPEAIADRMPVKDIADDFGSAGQAFQTRQTVVREFPAKPEADWNDFERATGVPVRSIAATPLMMEDETPIGVVQLINKDHGTFNEMDTAVLDTVAAVATMAYLNFRLTEESTRASTLLGMGKVSHDIGNLAASLHATLSFTDLAMDGLRTHLMAHNPDETTLMYVDSLEPMFGDLSNSVDRIVGYSRLISDISAGRPLRPNMVVAPMASTIETSAAYLESEGRANHVALRYDVDMSGPATNHDELYIFRIVQNLVGNAIKAVKEMVPDDWQTIGDTDEESYYGEVWVRYRFKDNQHVVEVQDSGPGMSRDIAERILSGNAKSEWEKTGGSGWGTKIVLELAKTHEGFVSIESVIGEGSIFRVAFPHHG